MEVRKATVSVQAPHWRTGIAVLKMTVRLERLDAFQPVHGLAILIALGESQEISVGTPRYDTVSAYHVPEPFNTNQEGDQHSPHAYIKSQDHSQQVSQDTVILHDKHPQRPAPLNRPNG